MASDGLPLADYNGVFAKMFVPIALLSSYRYNLETQLYALPSSGISEIEHYKLTFRFSAFFIGFGTTTVYEYHRTNPAGFVKWDAAPGSTQSIKDRTGGALNTGLEPQTAWYLAPLFSASAGLDMNITEDLFSFVSTTSALDAPQGTPLNKVYLFQNTGTNGTSSQKYIAQERFVSGGNTYYNQNHTDFTARNAQWIYNEMEKINQPPLDCKDYCDISSMPISGKDNLCSCETYTIDGLVPDATVTWSASPSGYVTITPNGHSAQVCKEFNGNITLTATITSATCGNGTIHKQITVGTPRISGTYTDHNGQHPMKYWAFPGGYNDVCKSYNAQTNMQVSGSSSVGWQRIQASNQALSWNQSGNDIHFYFWATGQREAFRVSASNSCGTTSEEFAFQAINCSGGGGGGGGGGDPCDIFLLSPNPARSTIQVGVHPNIPAPCDNILQSQATEQGKTTGDAKTVSTRNRFIQQVRIYNNKGTLLQQHKYSTANRKATLNVSKLPPGIYIVRITDGTYTENHRVVIK